MHTPNSRLIQRRLPSLDQGRTGFSRVVNARGFGKIAVVIGDDSVVASRGRDGGRSGGTYAGKLESNVEVHDSVACST